MATRIASLRTNQCLQRLSRLSNARTMSSAATPASTKKSEFIVLIPDKPGAQEKRLSVRQRHFNEITSKSEPGTWKMGGAYLHDVPQGTDPAKFNFAGSVVIAVAESHGQVVDQLKTDVYYTSGVWDLEKAQIYPYLNAFRNP